MKFSYLIASTIALASSTFALPQQIPSSWAGSVNSTQFNATIPKLDATVPKFDATVPPMPSVNPINTPSVGLGSVMNQIGAQQYGDFLFKPVLFRNTDLVFKLTYIGNSGCLDLNSKKINLRKDIRSGRDEDVVGETTTLDGRPLDSLCKNDERTIRIHLKQPFNDACTQGSTTSTEQLFIKIRVKGKHDKDIRGVYPCSRIAPA